MFACFGNVGSSHDLQLISITHMWSKGINAQINAINTKHFHCDLQANLYYTHMIKQANVFWKAPSQRCLQVQRLWCYGPSDTFRSVPWGWAAETQRGGTFAMSFFSMAGLFRPSPRRWSTRWTCTRLMWSIAATPDACWHRQLKSWLEICQVGSRAFWRSSRVTLVRLSMRLSGIRTCWRWKHFATFKLLRGHVTKVNPTFHFWCANKTPKR